MDGRNAEKRLLCKSFLTLCFGLGGSAASLGVILKCCSWEDHTKHVKQSHHKVEVLKKSMCQCKDSVASALSQFFLNDIDSYPWKDRKVSKDVSKIQDAVRCRKVLRVVWLPSLCILFFFWGGKSGFCSFCFLSQTKQGRKKSSQRFKSGF